MEVLPRGTGLAEVWSVVLKGVPVSGTALGNVASGAAEGVAMIAGCVARVQDVQPLPNTDMTAVTMTTHGLQTYAADAVAALAATLQPAIGTPGAAVPQPQKHEQEQREYPHVVVEPRWGNFRSPTHTDPRVGIPVNFERLGFEVRIDAEATDASATLAAYSVAVVEGAVARCIDTSVANSRDMTFSVMVEGRGAFVEPAVALWAESVRRASTDPEAAITVTGVELPEDYAPSLQTLGASVSIGRSTSYRPEEVPELRASAAAPQAQVRAADVSALEYRLKSVPGSGPAARRGPAAAVPGQ